MLCCPELTKPLKFDCFTEPHLSFAFMHKSFLIYTCEQQRFVFTKMAYRLNETRDELQIHIYILGDTKNCSLRRHFLVYTIYVLVEAF